VAADASAWEATALDSIAAAGRHLTLVRRCLDLTDLLATATAGTADVALVSSRLRGLDADVVGRLLAQGVRVVAVIPGGASAVTEHEVGEPERLQRSGVTRVVGGDEVAAVADVLREAVDLWEGTEGPADWGPPEPATVEDPPERTGRLVAVWGPTGGPGRTTLAVGIAAEAAHRGLSVSLLDADPYGGAAGQHLAVLEEVSGLLAATRLANMGTLDAAALARVAREVMPGLRLVTGLPRPDRWNEVRSQAFREVLSVARRLDELVVVDTGFGLPEPTVDVFGGGPARDDMTLAAIEEADEVVVVASADPVGLTRLARSLRDLLDLRPGGPSHVVVNRMRGTLGWTERDIRYLVGGVTPRATVTFLPDDRAAADRAMVTGRPLVEGGDAPLRRAVAAVVDVLVGGAVMPRARR
jgi:MinD-like ATPase involved in chromosome partitioning or flagellar assembly